ncbi:uncharacterized protein LOC125486046 [Rhincodon typus]|uniref:uncharacterized protein LOC125486046 n=1 Tax=Rhincodon typus TaxID=259920 RepID=UPI00202DB843|nr:uncharacterized protein LOC125486046 [Rhincodon typus]
MQSLISKEQHRHKGQYLNCKEETTLKTTSLNSSLALMEASELFQQQTEYLVNILLDEESSNDFATGFRCLAPSEEPVEDAEAISSLGHHLRELGDLINREHLDSFTRDFQRLAAQQAAEKTCQLFFDTVDQISKEQFHELAIEKNLLKVAGSLGKQASKEMPDLLEEIKASMQSFMSTRLGSWISAVGGWVWHIPGICAIAVTRAVFHFIWRSNMDCVHRDTMYKPLDNGGRTYPTSLSSRRPTLCVAASSCA